MNSTTLVVAVLLAACGGIAGAIAYGKGESFGAWFAIGVALGLIGVVWIACKPTNHRARDAREIAAGRAKMCPWCASVIPVEASVCPHCQRWIVYPPY